MSTDLHDRPRQPPPEEGPDKQPPAKSSLSIAQVVGGALAAMTAAALGSRLSLAGTVVGAAFASVIAAVAGSIYTSSLRRTSKHVSTVWSRVRPAAPVQGATTPAADATAVSPTTAHDDAAAGWMLPATTQTTAPARRRIGWKPVLLAAVLMFVIAALALTGIELVTGHALSGGTGTTVGQVADGGAKPSSTPTRHATSTPSATPSATASAEPSTSTSATPSSEPTPEPTATPSDTPSASVSPTPASTPSSAVSPTATAAS